MHDLRLDLDLLDPSLTAWLADEVRVDEPGPLAGPGTLRVHAASCSSEPLGPSRYESRRAFLSGFGDMRLSGGPCPCCAPGGHLPEVLVGLNRINLTARTCAGQPLHFYLLQDAWVCGEEIALALGALPVWELVEPAVISFQAQLAAHWEPWVHWLRSDEAPAALDLLASVVDAGDDQLLLRHFRLVPGEATPPLPVEEALCASALQATAIAWKSPVTAVEELVTAFLAKHTARTRPAGLALVHFPGWEAGQLVASDHLDVALAFRWSLERGVLVLPASALPVVLAAGAHVTYTLLDAPDPVVLETAAAILAQGDVTAQEALQAARALEA